MNRNLLALAAFLLVQAPAAPQAFGLPQLSAESKACVECHKAEDPSIYQQWGWSRHFRANVGCFECHAAKEGEPDAFKADTPVAIKGIRQPTKGGVDHGLEMAGSVKALELAYQITRRGGTTTTAGLANPAHTMALAPVRLVGEERTLKGSYVGSCIPVRDIPRFIDLYLRGRLPVDKLWTSSSPLDGINEGFDALNEGRTIRHIIQM